ncbi:MAG TPA: hypothetical protein VH081_03415 [Solirubrobacteraceae bacterium]|jgi:hypothetical protein|nr:hypothetical protein [Solirubrobacteraceae bacterium]
MSRKRIWPALALLLALAALASAATALAQPFEDEAGASWKLEQPQPPEPPPGVAPSSTPVGLGQIGDIKFWAPNRGLLITAGNGKTIPPGVWAYNGERWHELSNQCGATDGRIAWAGPNEFWTVSDGRPGQASVNGKVPPIIDDTLCHFAGGAIVGSYASLAFQPSSYQPMHAAGCFLEGSGSKDCWFAGDPLAEPATGAFHLNWNGSTLSAAPNPQGRAVEDIAEYEGSLYESVRVRPRQEPLKPSEEDRLSEPEPAGEPSLIHQIAPAGVEPTFTSLFPGLPTYAPGSSPSALSFLHLSAGAEAMWAAAGATREKPSTSEQPGQATVLRDAGGQWSEPIGPGSGAPDPFAQEAIESIAADPETGAAWLAVDSQEDAAQPSPTAEATVARVAADGTISDTETLPAAAEGGGGKGAAKQIVCPAVHDCWMTTTQGWLFHLAPEGERTLPRDEDSAFDGGNPSFSGPTIITRPEDQGLPQVPPDEPPIDDSGLLGEPPAAAALLPEVHAEEEDRVPVALLSQIHSRLVHGTTLELRFHLAVNARVRLIAKRKKKVVASTAMRTFAAGNRKLLLRLNAKRWPTKLDLQTHALAPLPTTSTRGAGTDSVSTGAAFPVDLADPTGALLASGLRPSS